MLSGATATRLRGRLIDDRSPTRHERPGVGADLDALTGLAGRAPFVDRLTRATEGHTDRSPVWVLLLGIDGLRHVNTAFGHPAGDEVLVAIARRLGDEVGARGMLARVGGDEFAVLLTDCTRDEAEDACARMHQSLRSPFRVAGRRLRMGVSVGVATSIDRGAGADLLQDADIAMRRVKVFGRGGIATIDSEMRATAMYQAAMRHDIAAAVERGEIDVHFQPIVDLASGLPVAFEALARWRRADGLLVPCEHFIPVAEESGNLGVIGDEVLAQACDAAMGWRASTRWSEVGVTVNVSLAEVMSGEVPDRVMRALWESGLPASALTLEITETTALDQPDMLVTEVAKLRDLGVRIALDDFGAGYFSLTPVMQLMPDVLKLDRTLVESDAVLRGALVGALSGLAGTLGIEVVAEGVETADHLAYVRDACCDAAQGFHLGRPLPADQVAEYLDEALANL